MTQDVLPPVQLDDDNGAVEDITCHTPLPKDLTGLVVGAETESLPSGTSCERWR